MNIGNSGLFITNSGQPLDHQALILNPDDGWNNHGTTLNVLERYEEAIESFENAIGINPNFRGVLPYI